MQVRVITVKVKHTCCGVFKGACELSGVVGCYFTYFGGYMQKFRRNTPPASTFL